MGWNLPQGGVWRNQDDGSNAQLLTNEIVRYSQPMRTNFLSNKVGEYVIQNEIREKFWPNTKCCFSDFPHEMEVPYSLKVSDEFLSAVVRGKLDHGVKLCHRGLKSLTIADKAQDKDLSHYIPQAVSQIAFEVLKLRKTFPYVPELYVGLVQNGRNWVGIFHKVECGEIKMMDPRRNC